MRDDELIDGVGFADPGGRSALRAATRNNPRNLPCPTCWALVWLSLDCPACHGAGRAMSRHAATRRWQGRAVQNELASRGILVRSPSPRGMAEEAPGAYKDVSEVVTATDRAGLAKLVARLEPLVCIKG